MTAKISGFLVGLGLMSLIVGIFIINLGAFTSEYDVNYDNSSLETYEKLESLNKDAEEIRNSTVNINTQDLSFKDVVGGYFTSGYNAMLLSVKGIDTFSSVYEQGLNDANLGESTIYLRAYLFYALIIIIFIGIIISAIIKKDI